MNNNTPRGSQSATSFSMPAAGCPTIPTPYMFGGGEGPRGALSSTNIRSGTGNRNGGSIRDCLFWPQTLTSDLTSGSNYGNNSNNNAYAGGHQMSYKPNSLSVGRTAKEYFQACEGSPSNGQAKAFILGQGGHGETMRHQIPCQMGPTGSKMTAFTPLEPVTIKVQAPPGAGANGQPISFTISPNELYGGARCQPQSTEFYGAPR